MVIISLVSFRSARRQPVHAVAVVEYRFRAVKEVWAGSPVGDVAARPSKSAAVASFLAAPVRAGRACRVDGSVAADNPKRVHRSI